MPGRRGSTSDSESPSSSNLSELEVRAEEADAAVAANAGEDDDRRRTSGGQEIDPSRFDELVMEPRSIEEAQKSWEAFIKQAGSAEVAGDAIYTSLFESAPSLQSLFITPKAVQALRFMHGMGTAVKALNTPASLKAAVETLGFQHLHLDVTPPRVVIFRDAILDLLEVELEDRFSSVARTAWMVLLNYIGGAFIYVRNNFAERLTMLVESWRIANRGTAVMNKALEAEEDSSEEEREREAQKQREKEQQQAEKKRKKKQQQQQQQNKGAGGGSPSSGAAKEKPTGTSDSSQPKSMSMMTRSVPTTFREMFQFNASVMGFGKKPWMKEVLASFGDMVEHVSNSPRLQEECDVVALRISKSLGNDGGVDLGEYRSCMLASLRQLLMTEWNTSYETAWNWFWDYVEAALKRTLGSPTGWEKSLTSFFLELDPPSKSAIIKSLYERFFVAAPRGQDFFKQSTSRLHFIASQLLKLSVEILRDPWKKVDDISALGLRHVGYGIPIDLFSPFVTACMQAIAAHGVDKQTLEAFNWSVGLITKILVRTVVEGSTIVMKAINVNSPKALAKAMSCAPRGERARWLLVVKVGTHSISPLSWAIESGSLEVADAIIKDLLTIRADRERYYFGVDELFERHPDLIKRLVVEAPSLLQTLLNGLVWRSRETNQGKRRANFYVKHLLVSGDGSFSDALKHFVGANDPQIICHPVIILVSDTLWDGIVQTRFINSRVWLILSLAIMMLSQAIVPRMETFEQMRSLRWVTLVGRILLYLGTMSRFLVVHARDIARSYRHKKVFRTYYVPIPNYLQDPYHLASLVLALLLLLMSVHEPMIYCAGQSGWPTEACSAALDVEFRYSVFCMCAMGTHWLMLMDLAVFNTGLTAFLLVIVNVMSEIGLFLVALCFLLLTFASAIAVLEHTYHDMSNVSDTFIALFAITVRLYEDDYRDFVEDPVLLGAVFMFVTASAILLLNLLIAQLNCSYVYIYQNMVGFARLKRASVIVETLSVCSPKRWERFVASLGLDNPLEFNEGDVGLPGGLQVEEPASLHSVRHDGILRFGGSSSADLCWPDETTTRGEDRVARMERLLNKTMKRITRLRSHNHSSSDEYGSGVEYTSEASSKGMQQD